MRLLQQLIDYCHSRGLLSPDQLKELDAINASCFGVSYDDYYCCTTCGALYEHCTCVWICDGCGKDSNHCLCPYFEELDERERLAEKLYGPTKNKRGRSGSKRNRQKRLKLPALSERLRDVFERRLADSPETFGVLATLYRLAGLSPLDDELPDWPRFQAIVKGLYGLKEEKIVPKMEESLLSKQKTSLSLHSICMLIIDSTEDDTHKPHFGPAVTAFRSLLQLGDQAPPLKLLWPLKDDVVNMVFQYRCLKQRLIRFLRKNWQLRSEKLTNEGRDEFRIGHQNRPWETISNRTQKEVEVLLRIGKYRAEQLPIEHLFSQDDLTEGIPVYLFENSSWELGMLVDSKNVMPLVMGEFSSKGIHSMPPSLNEGKDCVVLTVKDVDFIFRWCPAGSFMMGYPEYKTYSSGKSRVQVTLTQGFWMQETQVTQKMWEKLMGFNPSCFIGQRRPVENVSWDDCQDFIRKLNEFTPPSYRFSLPTEAQWEYACRAGTDTRFHFGDSLNGELVNCRGDYWRSKTTNVGSYTPNPWGLYDMHGNVSEWCWDWYETIEVVRHCHRLNPIGPPSGQVKVYRGGSWDSYPWSCQSASRYAKPPSHRSSRLGLRLCIVCNSIEDGDGS